MQDKDNLSQPSEENENNEVVEESSMDEIQPESSVPSFLEEEPIPLDPSTDDDVPSEAEVTPPMDEVSEKKEESK